MSGTYVALNEDAILATIDHSDNPMTSVRILVDGVKSLRAERDAAELTAEARSVHAVLRAALPNEPEGSTQDMARAVIRHRDAVMAESGERLARDLATAERDALRLRVAAMQEALDQLEYDGDGDPNEVHCIAYPTRAFVAPLWSEERRKREGIE